MFLGKVATYQVFFDGNEGQIDPNCCEVQFSFKFVEVFMNFVSIVVKSYLNKVF